MAVNLFIVFILLMLQKPSARSKTMDHVRYLKKRLTLWKEGKLDEVMAECEEIQKKITRSKRKPEETRRGFTRLAMSGKVRQALKLVDADSDVVGVHKIDDQIRKTLLEKHPPAEQPQPDVLDDAEIGRVEEVIF